MFFNIDFAVFCLAWSLDGYRPDYANTLKFSENSLIIHPFQPYPSSKYIVDLF